MVDTALINNKIRLFSLIIKCFTCTNWEILTPKYAFFYFLASTDDPFLMCNNEIVPLVLPVIGTVNLRNNPAG